jgi:hypothetical protein
MARLTEGKNWAGQFKSSIITCKVIIPYLAQGATKISRILQWAPAFPKIKNANQQNFVEGLA